MLSVSLADAPVQMRVFHIGVVVVGGFLPCGIRWVADNHANIQRLLPFAAFAVIFHCAVQQVVFSYIWKVSVRQIPLNGVYLLLSAVFPLIWGWIMP